MNAVLRALNRLVLRACDPDPRRRFRDAREMLDKLPAVGAAPPAPSLFGRARVMTILAAGVLVGVALLLWWLWPRHPGQVHVNFITEPAEAAIYLNGAPLRPPDGTPYATPCTVRNLPARSCHVVFRLEGADDLDAGDVDFSETREVNARWPDLPR